MKGRTLNSCKYRTEYYTAIGKRNRKEKGEKELDYFESKKTYANH